MSSATNTDPRSLFTFIRLAISWLLYASEVVITYCVHNASAGVYVRARLFHRWADSIAH